VNKRNHHSKNEISHAHWFLTFGVWSGVFSEEFIMSDEVERDDLRVQFSGETKPAKWLINVAQHRFADAMREYAEDEAPRLFALCEESEPWEIGDIVGWGFAFDDSAMWVSPDFHTRGVHDSAEAARKLVQRLRRAPVHLVWPRSHRKAA
jgi:hypothetical protein